jgi:hypothetical protein
MVSGVGGVAAGPQALSTRVATSKTNMDTNRFLRISFLL